MSTTAAHGFWESLFQDKVTRRVVEIATVLAAVWLIYELIDKMLNNMPVAEWNRMKLMDNSPFSAGYVPPVAPPHYTNHTREDYPALADKLSDDVKFIGDDSVNDIISIIESMKTKTDLALLVAAYNEGETGIFHVHDKLLDVLEKDFNRDQKTQFAKWVNDLPDTVLVAGGSW